MTRQARDFAVAAGALGFALGGFFDGILLHQILQWHHLLSGLPQAADDLRLLVMTDGFFHLAMYAVAAFGLAWLWRARSGLDAPGAGSSMVASVMIGFGAWHVTDAVLSHWLLGIHRIRMESDVPLAWDILWLVVFGLIPIMLGFRIRRGNHSLTGRSAPLVLAALTSGAGAVQAVPPSAEAPVVVLFRQGMDEVQMMGAIEVVDGKLAGRDATGTLWIVAVPDGVSTAGLYARGALVVTGTWLPAGCLDYTRTSEV